MEKYLIFFKSIEEILLKINRTDIEVIKSATIKEVEDLEKNTAISFPLAYKVWLLVFGNGILDNDGLRFTIENTLFAQEELKELAKEVDSFNIIEFFPNLKDNIIFIDCISENYTFTLLETSDDNPKVYCYLGRELLYLVSNSFTDHIRESLYSVLTYGAIVKKSEKYLNLFPWLLMYTEENKDTIFKKRKEFLSFFQTTDYMGRILTLEEVEMAFQTFYLENVTYN